LLPAVFITIGTFLIEARMIFFALGLVAGAWLIAKNFKKEQKLEKLENDIPDALFAISSMPGSLGLERVFMTIENGGFGELSKEIGIARKQLAINIKPETVVDCLIAKNRSVLLREMVIMLRQMIETNSLGRTGELADDIIRHIQTRRERSQLLATQKYTLMLGAVLIPLILKTTIGLVSSMGSVFSNSDLTGVLSDCNLLLPPYLVIYVSMVSIAIADSEGKRSSANLYLVVLSAISLATFYFINI
jgi:archaellum biogenesis protein FlaJ (TadC family)